MNRIGFGVIVVLLLSSILAVAAPADNGGAKDIVDTAVAAGSFKTLVTALEAADLVGTLKGAGPFTFLLPPTKRSRSCRPARWPTCSNPRTKTNCAPS